MRADQYLLDKVVAAGLIASEHCGKALYGHEVARRELVKCHSTSAWWLVHAVHALSGPIRCAKSADFWLHGDRQAEHFNLFAF
jgi:hypothetical protein